MYWKQVIEHRFKGVQINKCLKWSMKKLNKEYIELLQRNNNRAKNFWDLEEKIFRDKRRIGVVINIWKSITLENIL